MEEFGNAKAAWLKRYLTLPAGISHDTFNWVFRLLNADEFQRRFMRWVEQHFGIAPGQVIAVDGKTARGSRDSFRGQDAIHPASALASEVGVLLGQRKVDSKVQRDYRRTPYCSAAVPERLYRDGRCAQLPKGHR